MVQLLASIMTLYNNSPSCFFHSFLAKAFTSTWPKLSLLTSLMNPLWCCRTRKHTNTPSRTPTHPHAHQHTLTHSHMHAHTHSNTNARQLWRASLLIYVHRWSGHCLKGSDINGCCCCCSSKADSLKIKSSFWRSQTRLSGPQKSQARSPVNKETSEPCPSIFTFIDVGASC